MATRTVTSVLLGIVVLFVGVIAVSEQAQQVEPTLNSTAANESYSVSTEVFGGVMNAGGQGIVWFGIAAVVLVALGLLVAAASGGGR